MASRASLIQSRSIYVGTLNSVAPSDGNLIVTGSVGIGTTSPLSLLHVYGSNPRNLIQDAGAGYPYVQLNNSSGNFYLSIDNSAGTGFGSAYGRYLYSEGAYPMILVTNSAERMRITSDGNVGIGTTAPYDKLEVNGAIAATGSVAGDSGQGHSTTLAVQSGVSYLYAVDWGAEFKPLSIQGKTISLETGTGSTSARVTIDNSGNVGIGTTSPAYKLDVVAGDIRIMNVGGPTLNFSDNVDQNWDIGVDATTNDFYFKNGISGVRHLTIEDAGNVGIGTTSPDQKLVVSGNIRIPQNNYLYFDNTAHYIRRGASDVEIQGFNGLQLRTNDSARVYINQSGNVGIGTTAPTAKLHVQGSSPSVLVYSDTTTGGKIDFVDQAWQSQIVGTGGNLLFNTGGTSERMRITSAGNVGIGTTSIANAISGTETILKISNSNIASLYFESTGAGGFANYLNSARNLVWYDLTAGAERMRITAAGNVGIGTTAPYQSKLHVTKSEAGATPMAVLRIGNQGAGYTSRIILTDETTNDANISYLGATQSLGFGLGTSLSQMVLTSAGNVGIGTATPSAKLEVVSGSTPFIRATFSASYYTDFDTNGIDFRGPAQTFDFKDNGSSVVRIASGGNVGIGTTAPASILHLYKTSYPVLTLGSGVVTGNMGIDTGSNFMSIGTETNHGLSFATNNTAQMRLTPVGNLGIGTTSPGYKLSVAGSGHSWNINPHSGGIDLYSTGNIAPHYQTTFDWYTGAPGAGTFRMGLTAAGNLGIGTTAPTRPLTVVSTQWDNSTGAGAIFSNSNSVGAGITLQPSASVVTNGSNGWALYAGGPDAAIGDGNIGFWAHGTNDARMVIQRVGNVGIGTTSPSTQLNVMTATNAVDVLRIDNSGGNSGSVQGVTHVAINHFGTGTNPSTRITAYQDSTSGWPGGMYFSTRSLNTDSAPVERMRITSAGNVGIGTTSPQYMLDVNGDAQINAIGDAPSNTYVPDGAFGVDNLITSGTENVALGKPDVWLRIHVDGVAFVFPGYQEP